MRSLPLLNNSEVLFYKSATPKPHTDEVLRTAYYESINAEIDRVAREGRLNTTWYDALSREYGRAYEQHQKPEQQYAARQKERETNAPAVCRRLRKPPM